MPGKRRQALLDAEYLLQCIHVDLRSKLPRVLRCLRRHGDLSGCGIGITQRADFLTYLEARTAATGLPLGDPDDVAGEVHAFHQDRLDEMDDAADLPIA